MGKTFFSVYTIVLTLLLIWTFFTPVLAFTDSPQTQTAYDVGVYLCHQKISRSICIFKTLDSYYIGDCTKQNGQYVEGDNRIIKAVDEKGNIGFKLPICSRDIGIYLAMLIGGLYCYKTRKIDSKDIPPSIWLVLALIPLGIDGTTQLLSNFGISLPFIGFYESTNLVRLITGLISGIALPFYIFPLVNAYSRKAEEPKKKSESNAEQN